jgi:hypothetical protein
LWILFQAGLPKYPAFHPTLSDNHPQPLKSGFAPLLVQFQLLLMNGLQSFLRLCWRSKSTHPYHTNSKKQAFYAFFVPTSFVTLPRLFRETTL